MKLENSQDTAHLAQRFGFSESAIEELAAAMKRGHGTMAQFNHPELGGPGQWTKGGLLMIGDMFNDGLKAKVNEICAELAKLPPDQKEDDRWWGEDLGYVGASGSQNEMKYAYFPAAHRLATRKADQVTIYDTGDHEIGGVSQQQSGSSAMSFVSQLGDVSLDQLRVVRK